LVDPGETWKGVLVVDKDGLIELPNLGKVSVEGPTTEAVERVLGEKLSWDGMHGVLRGVVPEIGVGRVGT
jgi:protein involved in polysaccharide export with SLBB domain